MILYFADRGMDILGMAATGLPSRNAFMILEDKKSEDIDSGVSVFECTIAWTEESQLKAQEMCEAGNYILRSNDDANEFYTIIDETIDTESQTIEIYAEDAGLDLLNEVVGEFEADASHDALWYINKYIDDSGFEIGTYQIPNTTKKLKWDGESTVTERLASIATEFGGFEISYSFKVKGLKVVHKYINVYKKRGKSAGIKLRRNREVKKITTKRSVANLATAFKCTGGTPSGKSKPITLAGYSYDDGEYYVSGQLLCCRSAVKKWSRYRWENRGLSSGEGHLVREYSYDTTSQSTLCNHAIAELKKVQDTEINYEIELDLIPEGVEIGDWVDVIDDNGELYVGARVLKMETSAVDQKCSITLGEFLIKNSGISGKVLELASEFQRLSANRTWFTWFAYADDDQGTNISLSSTGKAYLGISANHTSETVDISDPSVFAWTKIQGEHGDAITVSVDSSNGLLFKNTKISTLLTARVFKSGVELEAAAIAGLGVLNWYNSSGTKVGSGKTYTVSVNAQAVTYTVELEEG